MLYIVFTTGMCNLRYSYCGGSFPESMVPWDVKYRVSTLIDFVSQDSDSTVAFYGGKPLLNVAFTRLVMDGMDARFVIQTTSCLLGGLNPNAGPSLKQFSYSWIVWSGLQTYIDTGGLQEGFRGC